LPSLTFPFNDPANYDFDSDDIDVSGGNASLALQQADIGFTEDFNNDIGHTYDPTKGEFSGGKFQQKSQRPTGATFYAPYSSDINGAWGNGTLTGTASGGAAVSGGRLDLTGGVLGKNVSYSPTNNINNGQKGCIRISFTPNYSGAPATGQYLCSTSRIGNNSWISVYHYFNGYIRGTIYDDSGVIIGEALYYWITNVAGTPYEIEYNYDLDSGDMRLFIDGTMVKYTSGATGTISTALTNFYVGRFYNDAQPDFYLNKLLIFNSVQHTTNYTPDWSGIKETDYVETSDVLPEMEHTGDGAINLFNSLALTYSGSIGILLEIGRSGDKLFWNGTAWVASNGTYAQSTDLTTFNLHCATLDVYGEKYGQFTIIFPASNTQSSISELTANMNVDYGYLTTNPYLKILTGFRTDELQGFFETLAESLSGSDAITYILQNGSDFYYLAGGVWTKGSLQYSNSSSSTDINTYCADLTDTSSYWYIYVFFHSGDGSTTPKLDTLKIDFSYGGETPDTVNTCLVWGYTYDGNGEALTDTFTVKLNVETAQYKDYTSIRTTELTVTPDPVGYWEIELIETENMLAPNGEEPKYIFDFGNNDIYRKNIPNEETKAFYDLV